MIVPKLTISALTLVCSTLILSTGCPSKGGGSGDGTAGGDTTAEGFGDDETWFITAEPSTPGGVAAQLSGFGDTVDIVQLLTDADPFAPEGCFAFEPEATLIFDGETISVEAGFVDDRTGQACSIELTGSVTSCPGDLPPGLAPPNSLCATAEGVTTIAGEEFLVGDLRIDRVESCDPAPVSLVDQQWTLINYHVAALGNEFIAVSYDVVIDVHGLGNVVQSGSLSQFPGVEEDLSMGCDEEWPQGSVSFDGQTLSMELVGGFPGGIGDELAEETCAMSFTGTVTYCQDFPSFGPDGDDSLSILTLRIDGAGSHIVADQEGTFTTMYLILNPF